MHKKVSLSRLTQTKVMSALSSPAPNKHMWLFRALAALVFLVGFYSANARILSLWLPWSDWENGGVDFPVLYAMARGVAEAINVYELNAPGQVGQGVVGMVYPPATGFAVLPLAFLPFPVARAVFFVLMNLTLILGVRTLVRHLAPRSDEYMWLFAAGLVLMAASIRWGMMLLQVAPLILGLLCFFVVALDRGQYKVALAIAMLATAFKITLALPFLGLMLLHRRFFGFGIVIGIWVLLNALGFLRMGDAAFATYRANVAIFEQVDASWNINGPDPWLGVSLPRLDWVFLFYGIFGNLPVSRLANLFFAGVTTLWLFWESWRTRHSPVTIETTQLFLTPLVCLGSLAVYHHQYDACLFLAPIAIACFLSRRLWQPIWGALLCAPLLFIVLLLPIGKAQDVLGGLFGPTGVGLVKISFPIAITLALIGSLAFLRSNLGSNRRRGENA